MSLRFPRRALTPLLAVVLTAGAGPPPLAVLRICADPDNLPFSNRQGGGFENRIAALLARELHASVIYAWRAQRRGFVRKSLDTGACDAVMGVPATMDALLRTAPYYRSSYVFVTRRSRGIGVRSFDDSALKHLRIGVQVIGDDGADTPPALALARRGIISNVTSFPVPDDAAPNGAAPRIIAAVTRGQVDLAVAWGPLAGYWAGRAGAPLSITPAVAPADLGFLPFAFDIAVGVRRTNPGLRARLDSALTRRRSDIAKILDAYRVPRAVAPRTGTP